MNQPLLFIASASVAVCSLSNLRSEEGKPESLDDRISYAYGIIVAKDLKDRELPINEEQFTKAFKTILNGGEPKMTEEEINTAFEERQAGENADNLKAGREFLEENAKKEGVQVTRSGLQYKVIKAGDGAKPKATDSVKVHYHGTLLDGTVFDSSVDRDEPIVFPLNRVIPGWTEGVQLMKVGSKFRFYIPHELAYGERGAGPDIKPYSTLIFDVELLEIEG